MRRPHPTPTDIRRDDPATLDELQARQQRQDLLRFITCGSVDDGKSTLIGRLLWESHQVFEDQMRALDADSRRHGTQGDEPDFALLVDGLMAEREQGITIDVAYRYFGTARRRFIVADTPGHEQYTRNMVTAASTADVAVLLVHAGQGLMPQTRRHACLAHLMGIRQVVLAVNKMDTVGFDAGRFHQISGAFADFARELGLTQVTAIPLSALRGDNITRRSAHTPWYQGPTLLGCLETVKLPGNNTAQDFAFPVQSVNRPSPDFRGLMGTISSGHIRAGQEVRVTRTGQTARLARIVTADGDLPEAGAGAAVTLTLEQEVDASRGDVLSLSDAPLQTSDQFEATVVWLHEEPGLVGRTYELKLATQWAGASLTTIKHRVDVNQPSAREAARRLSLNDIGVCNIALSRAVAFTPYRTLKALGSFILVDRFTHATVAAGLLHHSLRRADHVHHQSLTVRREDRERLNGHPGRVIWFTGLSGSGKSTLANALEQALHQRGLRTYLLDGDNVRQGLNKDLGFTEADRVENIRRVAEVARLMADAGLVVLTAFISPFRQERRMARELIGEATFVEVFVDTPLEVCEQRDPKGLYRKARQGLIPNFTGIGSPYETPLDPEVVVRPQDTLEETVSRLAQRCLAPDSPGTA